MSTCNYCNKDIEEGYIGYDFYVICNKCIRELYTDDEYEKAYQNNDVFWTTFYKGD